MRLINGSACSLAGDRAEMVNAVADFINVNNERVRLSAFWREPLRLIIKRRDHRALLLNFGYEPLTTGRLYRLFAETLVERNLPFRVRTVMRPIGSQVYYCWFSPIVKVAPLL